MNKIIKSFCILATSLIGNSFSASAQDRAGEFDYYVMALSWSPNWCEREGDARNSPQCDPSEDHGFVLHGLWPQYETGWPSNCRSNFRDPSRAQTRDMADIMGSSGSAWHQWKKHGRCSGLNSLDYYALMREAFGEVNRPEVLRQISRAMDVAPLVIEDAFLEENAELDGDEITITCKSTQFQEVRICMTKELEFRRCGRDVIRDCRAKSVEILPIR